jgi:hypothetical protein
VVEPEPLPGPTEIFDGTTSDLGRSDGAQSTLSACGEQHDGGISSTLTFASRVFIAHSVGLWSASTVAVVLWCSSPD